MDAVRFLRFNYDMGDGRPKDSLLFYPYEEFRLKLLKKNFPQLLNKPATECKMKDMTLNLHPESRVLACAYSPDGRFLASTSESDNTISIWDVYTGKKIGQFLTRAHNRFDIRYIAFSASGALAAVTSSNTIEVWDFPTRNHIKTVRKETFSTRYWFWGFWDLTFSPDGKQLATANNEAILTWALPSFEEHTYRMSIPKIISRVRFLGDGLIAFSSNKTITIWREETAEDVHILRGHKEYITGLEFLPKRQWLASASDDESVIRLWDTKSGVELYTLDSHKPGIRSISLSFDETKLASGSKDDTIEIWDLESVGSDPQRLSMKKFENFEDHKCVKKVVFSPKELSLASALTKPTIQIWDTYDIQRQVKGSVTQKNRHTCAIKCLKFSHNGEFFATADCKGKICIWDGKTGVYRTAIGSNGCELHSISPDDQSLATSSADGTVAIWNTRNWHLTQKLIGHRGKILCVEFSPDGKHIASASHDKYIGIWELSNKCEFVETKPAHQIPAKFEIENENESLNKVKRKKFIRACIAFSPDGTKLACTVRGGAAIQIFNIMPDGSPHAPQQLQYDRGACSERIFFSQDAKFIVASGDGHLSLWSIKSKRRLKLIKFVPMIFQSLRWDPRDPKFILTELGRYFIGDAFDFKVNKLRQYPVCYEQWQPWVKLPESLNLESYELDTKGLGINWKGKPLVMFPSRYSPSCWDGIGMIWIHGKRIATAYESGHVMLMNFEGDDDAEI